MLLAALLLIVPLAAPSIANPSAARAPSIAARQNGLLGGLLNASSEAIQAVGNDIVEALDQFIGFDALTMPVDVTGAHSFKPPAAGDERGPCPGLNALANHGYIAHDGIVSFANTVAAIHRVYGMGIDLSLVLGVMGTAWAGQ